MAQTIENQRLKTSSFFSVKTENTLIYIDSSIISRMILFTQKPVFTTFKC